MQIAARPAEAGGEITALEWGDVDLKKRQLCVQRAVWQGRVEAPKGGRLRYVPLTRRLTAALQAAKLKHRGIHVLRHTFCSHLAMRGAPARAIQELAGHADLRTTQRYMHLSPAALESAIRLLEGESFGDIVETPIGETAKVNG